MSAAVFYYNCENCKSITVGKAFWGVEPRVAPLSGLLIEPLYT